MWPPTSPSWSRRTSSASILVPETTPNCPRCDTARASGQPETPIPIPPWMSRGQVMDAVEDSIVSLFAWVGRLLFSCSTLSDARLTAKCWNPIPCDGGPLATCRALFAWNRTSRVRRRAGFARRRFSPASPWRNLLRAARGAALRGTAGAIGAEPDGQVVDVDRAVAVEVGAAVRRAAQRAEVREPHRQVVDIDAVCTIEVQRGDRRRPEQKTIPEDAGAAQQRRGI